MCQRKSIHNFMWHLIPEDVVCPNNIHLYLIPLLYASPIVPDPIRVQPCVCYLFWTNGNSMAVTSFSLSHYPIRVMIPSIGAISKWKYVLLLKLCLFLLILTCLPTVYLWHVWFKLYPLAVMNKTYHFNSE